MQQPELAPVGFDISRLRGGFPATTFSYELIMDLSGKVCKLPRNTQTVLRMLELAGGFLEEINKLIMFTDKTGDWSAYDIHSQATDTLEEILSSSVDVIDEELDGSLSYICIEECQQSIEKWIKNRRLIRGRLHTLMWDDKLKALIPVTKGGKENILELYARDDYDFLKKLLLEVSVNASKIHRRETKELVEGVVIILGNIPNLRIGYSNELVQELTTFCIKWAMLVHGTTSIMIEWPTEQSQQDDYHSDIVWNAAQQLVGDLYQALESQKYTCAEIAGRYASFEDLLLLQQTSMTKIPEAYRQLVQLAGRVQQPYIAQLLALVRLWREVVIYLHRKADWRNYEPVERALEAAAKALEAATQVKTVEGGYVPPGDAELFSNVAETGTTAPSSSPAVDGIPTDDLYANLFQNSAGVLEICFQGIELESGLDPEKILHAAREKDISRTAKERGMMTHML